MSTREEMAEIIHNEFWRENGLKDSILQEVHKALNARIGKWLLMGGFGVIFVVMGGWFSLQAQVNDNTEKLNTALNQDQAALLIQRIDQLVNDNKDLKDSFRILDERLRNKGI